MPATIQAQGARLELSDGEPRIVGSDGITWVLTRPVRPTKTPFAGAYVHRDNRGPINCSIYDHGDFCLYCVASREWDKLAPHVSSGAKLKKEVTDLS